MKTKITSFEQLFKLMPNKQQDMLKSLKQIEERIDFHPEDNAYEHVKIVVERCIETGDNDLILAAIFHDIFKFKLNKPKIKAFGTIIVETPTAEEHEDKAALMVLDNSDLIKDLGGDPLMVAGICKFHMRMKRFKEMRKSKQGAMMRQPFFLKTAIFKRADDMLSTEPMPKLSGLIQDKVVFNRELGKIEIVGKRLKLW
jgi:hypothetical protein